jgi:hypothetical protein
MFDELHDGAFRNPNGVYMKLMNFRRLDVEFQAQGKTGLTRGASLKRWFGTSSPTTPITLEEWRMPSGKTLLKINSGLRVPVILVIP